MKKGMCNGCDNLLPDVPQTQFFDASGRKRLNVPTVTNKPFCREFRLHLEYVDRIVEGDNICLHYFRGGIS